MADSDDALKDEEDIYFQDTRGDTPNFAKYFQVMNSHGREIFFIITIVFTGIAALQSGYEILRYCIARPNPKLSPVVCKHCRSQTGQL